MSTLGFTTTFSGGIDTPANRVELNYLFYKLPEMNIIYKVTYSSRKDTILGIIYNW